MKLDLPMRMRFSLRSAAQTLIFAVAGIWIVLLSIENTAISSRERREISTLLLWGMISGRTLRLCGEIGATMNTLESGRQMGPPTLSEYAVEPELVATSSPSAHYVGRSEPSTQTSVPSIEALTRETLTSLRA